MSILREQHGVSSVIGSLKEDGAIKHRYLSWLDNLYSVDADVTFGLFGHEFTVNIMQTLNKLIFKLETFFQVFAHRGQVFGKLSELF